MASEQPQHQCDCGPRLQSARAAGHVAATAAVYAARPARKTSVTEPSVTEFQLIRDPEVTGSGAIPSHASAGAAIAHSKSLSHKESKGKQTTTGRPRSLIRDYHDTEASQTNRYSLEGFQAASSAVKESRAAATAASSLLPFSTMCDLRGGEWSADEHRTVGHHGALRAASGAFVNSRRRAESPPREDGLEPSEGLPAGVNPNSIQRTANENAERYVSEPVYELEGQNKRSVERAAAVSLARDAQDPSKKREELPSLYGRRPGRSRPRSQRYTISDPAAVQRAILLHYAAQDRAAKTIAEIPDGTTDYQKYYGIEPHPVRPTLFVRRRRTRSVDDASLADAQRSREIRNQMSTLRTKLQEVDEKKQRDRDQLMEVSRRNVDALLHDMERRVYIETGRTPTSMQREQEEASLGRVETGTEAHTTEAQTDFGSDMVDVGMGQYIDPAILEETARLRTRQRLEEIDDQLEGKRAREVEDRLDREERERLEGLKRQRETEIRAEKRQKARPGLFPVFDKMQDRAEERKARKIEERLDREESERLKMLEREREADMRSERQRVIAEEKRGRKMGLSRRSKAAEEREPPDQRDTTAVATEGRAEAEEGKVPSQMAPSASHGEGGVAAVAPVAVTNGAATKPAERSESRIKSWFRGRMARPAESAHEPHEDTSQRESTSRPATGSTAGVDESRRAPLSSHPVTGDDLAQMRNGDGHSTAGGLASQPSVEDNPPETGGDHPSQMGGGLVRTASRDSQEPAANGAATHDDGATGSATQSEPRTPDDRHHEAQHPGAQHPALTERENLRGSAAEHGLAPPPAVGEGESVSTGRESRFSEDL